MEATESKFVYLPKTTLDYLNKKNPNIDNRSSRVTQEDLDSISDVNLNEVDVMSLQYFRNLKTLIIEGFPGTDDRNFGYITRNCPNITTLVIKGQPHLTKIDLTRFTKLKNISIISNENLVKVAGFEGDSNFISQLDKIEFYDNVNYHKEDDLIRNIAKYKKDRIVELDALYYIDANKNIENFDQKYASYEWHEKIGFVDQRDMKYSSGEMDVAYNYARSIIDSIIKPNDTDEMKVFVIYTWILKNIKIEKDRERNLNEGIVNVFKYRVASISTIAKFFQFLLRVAGIESYDINVLPRNKFNSNRLGSFKIPSEDYEILKLPTEKGNYYFDIAWDNDIYKKTGRLSTVFMYNGLEDILYNHTLIYDKLDNQTESMTTEEKERYSGKALKRLQNVSSKLIDELTGTDDRIVDKIIASHSSMQSHLKAYLDSISRIRDKKEKLERKKADGKETMRTSANIKNLNTMLEATDSANKVLRENIYRLEEVLLEKLMEEDLSSIEDILGSEITPYKRIKISDTNYTRAIKTKDELEKELNMIRNTLSKKITNREIDLMNYQKVMNLATKIYTYLITFAYEKSIIMDSNLEVVNKKMS